jgi:hypothetical protein
VVFEEGVIFEGNNVKVVGGTVKPKTLKTGVYANLTVEL